MESPTHSQSEAQQIATPRKLLIGCLGAAVLLLTAVFLWLSLCRIYVVDGNSMAPTLQPGDEIKYVKYRDIEYGDIVVFRTGYDLVVKRVLGMPGDTVAVSADGSVVRNGSFVEEPYMVRDALNGSAMQETVIPEGCVFVLGDNRGVSVDSRDVRIGLIKPKDIAGCVTRISRSVALAEDSN